MMRINDKTAFSLAFLIGTSTFAATPVLAGSGGAFLGGVIATNLVRNVRDQNKAEQAQATAVRQYQPVSSPSAHSVKERINQLDKLAAGGYITPDEYKRKKQAIIDSI